MSENAKTNITISFNLPLILTIAFFIAKVTEKIDWNWWWVFSPLWITGTLVVLMFIIYIIIQCFSSTKYL